MMNKYLDVRCCRATGRSAVAEMFDVGCSMDFGSVSYPGRRPCMVFAALFLLLTGLCSPGRSESDPQPTPDNPSPLPEAREVMSRVRANMPDRPLLIKGRLLSGKRMGKPEDACHVDMLLYLGQEPAKARYTVIDLFGTPVEQLTVIRKPDLTPELHFEKGYPFGPAPTPDMNSAVQGTDITWNDLTLSFLWWRNGTTIGRENRMGRDCVIIEFAYPPRPGLDSDPAADGTGIPHKDQPASPSKDPDLQSGNAPPAAAGSAQLWIDEKLFMIIQVEEYDARGNRARKLSVKKIKKISDTWMIKDMEIRCYPSMHRTLLRVDDIVYPRQEQPTPPTP